MSGTSNIAGFRIPNWLIIAAVIFLFFTSMGAKVRQNAMQQGSDILSQFGVEPSETQEEVSKSRVPFYGNLDISVNEMDMLAGASCSPSNAAYNYHKNKPGKLTVGESVTTSGSTHRVDQRQSGKFWLEIYGGDDYYVPIEYFKASNPMVMSAMWEDYDEDGTDELLAQFDVSKISEPDPNTNPDLVVVMPEIDIDKTGWTDDDPSDISSIGTSESVQTVTHKFTGITAEDGAYIVELYYTTNATTEGDDIEFEELTLSGGWVQSSGAKTYWDQPIDTENQDYRAYYIYPSDRKEYHNGIRVWRDTNEADTLYISANIRCTLDSSDVITVTLNLEALDPTGASSSYTDSVTLSES